MKTGILTLALAAIAAMPAAAQSTTGKAQTTGTAIKVKNEVSPALASSVKVSADSALNIARAVTDSAEVSSAELKMDDKRLVYQVKLVNKEKKAIEVDVDAITAEVVKNKQFGGLKSEVIHDKEAKKLQDAKRDSAKKTP
jgi:uncharacterized membrane protein YkoI